MSTSTPTSSPQTPTPAPRQLDDELRRLRGRLRAGWAELARDANVRSVSGWATVLRRIGATRLLLGIGGLLALLMLVLPSSSSDPFDGPAGAIDLFLKLGIVVALAYASLAVLKRYTVGATRSTSMLQVLDSATLAPNRAVYVVRVGEKRLVLGVTTTQISTLAELDPDIQPAMQPAAPATLPLTAAPDAGRPAVNRRDIGAPSSPRRTFADHLAYADLTDPFQVNGHAGSEASPAPSPSDHSHDATAQPPI